jgi:hypothetical protein
MTINPPFTIRARRLCERRSRGVAMIVPVEVGAGGIATRKVDQGKITDFSYNMWSDLYTQERVDQLADAVRSIAAE